MAGQLSHFRSYTDDEHDYSLDRYTNEYERLLAVMDVRLRNRECLAGKLSIADFASFPWVVPYERLGVDLDRFTNVRRWFDTLKNRPKLRIGMELGADWQSDLTNEDAKAMLFRQNAETVYKAAEGLEQ